jgi:hypothetical protein
MQSSPQPRAVHRRREHVRQKWLLLFNCQAQGLANSLSVLCEDIEVEHHDPVSLQKHRGVILERARTCDRVVMAPGLIGQLGTDLAGRGNVTLVPSPLFFGYHPDFCDLEAGGRELNPRYGSGYNSVLAYAAFQHGMNEADALALYREDVYDALGYFDAWCAARHFFVQRYEQFGFDIASRFIAWTRNGAFMHTPNHPKILVLRDLAALILERMGMDIIQAEAIPHDNLAKGAVLPVYPEIGIRLGVRGNHLFKRGDAYRFASLRDFIGESFKMYRACGPIRPSAMHAPVVARAISLVAELR